MDAEDTFAARAVRQADLHVAIETARPEKNRIRHVRTVRRRENDDLVPVVEPIHLDQELVERLLALVVHGADTSASSATDSIQLVDEDDGWRGHLGLSEEI